MSSPLLEVPATLWRQLVSELAEAGGGFKEAGAFLLGQREPRRRVVDYELYSTIAPRSQEVDYVFLLGTDLARMWEECAQRGVAVVADVHTHPGGPRQSFSDRAHPIVAVPGHVALIIPNFALGEIPIEAIGVHEFRGSGKWKSWFGAAAAARLILTGEAHEVA